MIERVDPSPHPEAELRARGLEPRLWSAGPGAVFGRHSHAHDKRLFVIKGEISFDGLVLHDHDGILVPAGHVHSAVAGEQGVECVEAFEE
ncbi:MAG TPA: hypothetical protein VE219_05555 [Candidatus Sulfotelmatobacter sp.]|nr:hypothetical protein [Candidatus Sulfotelmatobacter sp.]